MKEGFNPQPNPAEQKLVPLPNNETIEGGQSHLPDQRTVNPEKGGRVSVEQEVFPGQQDRERIFVNMSLTERLDHIIQEDPERYNEATMAQVRQLVEHEINNPGKRKPYRILQEFDAYYLYHKLHPEWQGLSVSEFRSKVTGGHAFYTAFMKWVDKTAEDEKERVTLHKRIFEPEGKETNESKRFNLPKENERQITPHGYWQGEEGQENIRREAREILEREGRLTLTLLSKLGHNDLAN